MILAPVSKIVRALLLQEGVGVEGPSEDWTIFYDFLPENPDKAFAVYSTSGMSDGRIMSGGERVEHPGFQVFVRGMDVDEVFEAVGTVSSCLDQVLRATVFLDDVRYRVHSVSRKGAPIPLGVETEGDRRRYCVTINATLTVSVET